MKSELTIALVGNPNSGKTALFNALTGGRQKTANYPGVTVEKKEGFTRSPSGQDIRVIDLPGVTTGLAGESTLDEKVTRDVLSGNLDLGDARPSAIVAVVDATVPRRGLAFVLELKQLGLPVVVALNMVDLAQRRGQKIDVKKLSRLLDLPVVTTVATRRSGIYRLLDEVVRASVQKGNRAETGDIRDRFREAEKILAASITSKILPARWTERIDRVLLHPIAGFAVLGVVLTVTFQAVFSWSSVPQEWIEQGIDLLGRFLMENISTAWLSEILVDGVLAGVGSVIIFLPQILLLFAMIILLEDSGYLARAAFLMDRSMGKVGLHGKAFIPLLSSHACAVPGIMSTRTISGERDRLVTILIAPLTTCSARLPVYTLLIGAFIPQMEIGWFNLQGLVLLGLYLGGIASALIVAGVLKSTLLGGPRSPLLLEMPSYKVPSLLNFVLGLWERAKVFVLRVGKVILGLSVLLWFLATFPKTGDIQTSYAGRVGHFIEPIVAPIGFDWRIATGLIPGFAAREVMVGALGTVFAIEEAEKDQTSRLSHRIQETWSLATALSLLIWYVFSPQCVSTIAVTCRETQSYRWGFIMFSYMLFLAYGASFLTYQICVLLGLG